MSLDTEGSFLTAIIICAVLGLAIGRAFYQRLRRHHPETWEKLGSPTLFWNQSPKVQVAVSRFLWKSSYRQLEDPVLNRLASLLRCLGVLLVGLFVMGLVLTLGF